MALKLIKDGQFLDPNDRQFSELNKFCSDLDITFEWIDGQFWLHSDDPKENPIGVKIDQELTRHEDYFRRTSLHKELLARAIGVKGGHRPKVLDLTAGLLGDSLLFLSFGCEVWAFERHPVIQFLLSSALQNSYHPKIKNLHFVPGEALMALQENLPIETIYFDPMFEDANERALPRKEMRIFRKFVGKDQDAIDVFNRALEKKVKRLVVKRPRHSILLGPKPSVDYLGKSTRYDVYFPIL